MRPDFRLPTCVHTYPLACRPAFPLACWPAGLPYLPAPTHPNSRLPACGSYAALLMTFLSSAFFFEPEAAQGRTFEELLADVFLSAVFANAILLPFKFSLP